MPSEKIRLKRNLAKWQMKKKSEIILANLVNKTKISLQYSEETMKFLLFLSKWRKETEIEKHMKSKSSELQVVFEELKANGCIDYKHGESKSLSQ